MVERALYLILFSSGYLIFGLLSLTDMSNIYLPGDCVTFVVFSYFICVNVVNI